MLGFKQYRPMGKIIQIGLLYLCIYFFFRFVARPSLQAGSGGITAYVMHWLKYFN